MALQMWSKYATEEHLISTRDCRICCYDSDLILMHTTCNSVQHAKYFIEYPPHNVNLQYQQILNIFLSMPIQVLLQLTQGFQLSCPCGMSTSEWHLCSRVNTLVVQCVMVCFHLHQVDHYKLVTSCLPSL